MALSYQYEGLTDLWRKGKKHTKMSHKSHHLVASDFSVDIIVEIQIHIEHLETSAQIN